MLDLASDRAYLISDSSLSAFDTSGQQVVRLVFPRRMGLSMGWHGYETRLDLKTWTTAAGVTETMLATQTIDGDNTDAGQGGVRIRWRH